MQQVPFLGYIIAGISPCGSAGGLLWQSPCRLLNPRHLPQKQGLAQPLGDMAVVLASRAPFLGTLPDMQQQLLVC